MKELLSDGIYELYKAAGNTTILEINGCPYIWVPTHEAGDLIWCGDVIHRPVRIIATGRYELWDVHGVHHPTPVQHLELQSGHDFWRGYLLPTGLPDDHARHSHFVPSDELLHGTPTHLAVAGYK